jgi:hypothetical protein
MAIICRLYEYGARRAGYHAAMSNSEGAPDPTRVIAVVLTEDEWRAFRAVEAQPVAWVQQKIRERIDTPREHGSAELSRTA